MAQAWEHFAHGADIGVRGRGATLAGALSAAATAMTAVVTDPEAVRQTDAIEVLCRAPTPELLLVDWLNSLVYEMATRRMLFSGFEVECEGSVLRARVRGERVDVRRHQPAVEVKGATLTALDVHRGEDGTWVAQCVVDV